MTTVSDQAFIERALELAANALFDTDPNPAVGCVIVAAGKVVGEGWTRPAGGQHAEIVALEAAGAQALGATAYVTLEPCCHTGRTGPCTDALIRAGIARVVYSLDDPNPSVSGRGAAQLRAAGIDVASGPGAHAAGIINAGFISRMRRGRPFVRLKIAASLDGRTALQNGVSQWITAEPARADVHHWRARSSAVLTGIETVLQDDPRLSARPASAELKFLPPLRVVLDSQLRMPPGARMFADGQPVVVVTCSTQRRDDLPGHVEVVQVGAERSGRCALPQVLSLLGHRGINDVWVEAGRTLSGSLLRAGLVDELIIYTAPVILGDDAHGMTGRWGLTDMAERAEFDIDEVTRIGRDLRVVLHPVNLAHGGAPAPLKREILRDKQQQ